MPELPVPTYTDPRPLPFLMVVYHLDTYLVQGTEIDSVKQTTEKNPK